MEPVLCCFMFCEEVRRQGGRFTLAGIFYRIHAPAFPAARNCNIIVGWYGPEGYYDFGLQFLHPDGRQVLLEVPFYPFTLTRERPYYNAVINATLPLPEAGVYWFAVYRTGRRLAEFPLYVLPSGAGKILC